MRRLLLMGLALSGCLPLAWVNPPFDASAAVAVRDGEGRPAVVGDFEVVALPLNAWEGTADLPVDVGVGGRFHAARLASQRFARLEGRLTVPLTLYRDGVTRVASELSGGVTLDPAGDATLDPFASWRFLWGVETFVDKENGGGCESGSRSLACAGGVFHGLFGVNLFAEAAVMRVGEETLWLASTGFLLRAPASMGAGFLFFIP
ncbi:MAG: hypothetical protein H6706_15420 [Myxococcales bacterium]|nr:hypothetical protein [Myxococcales bacterium]